MLSRKAATVVSGLILGVMIGCKANVPQGFAVQTSYRFTSMSGTAGLGPEMSMPEVFVSGKGDRDQHTNQGNADTYAGTTDILGGYFVNNAILPAYWDHYTYWPSFCGTNFYVGPVGSGSTGFMEYEQPHVQEYQGSVLHWECQENFMSYASQRFAVAGSTPGTIQLGGLTPLTTTYGMPQIYVYDGTNSLQATVTASSVSSDGSTATFPFPSSLASQAYGIAISNKNQSGGSPAGFNFFSIGDSQSMLGGPFGVSVGSETWRSTSQNGCGSHHTSTTSTYQVSVPIISLISANQLVIDGTTISAGSGPAGVVAYHGPPEGVLSDDDGGDPCFSTVTRATGDTRALVANSANGTVSVVDIVNDSILSSIAVGFQPVAIAITSDASTAYVANYGDSTISKIDIASGTVSTSAQLPGQPTTVSITASGSVWTAGQGFIAQLDGSSLAFTATQSTGLKMVAGISYSNSLGRLVATTIDTSGVVATDHIDPVTVTSNASYAPMATNNISLTSQYFSPAANGNVSGSTGTIAGSTPLNPNQLGAPPLIVQDGWAVVSATPTGFSVSDLSGNNVIISEQTPSPVAAIAVDTRLSVAYLTLPDSNKVLVVPLPGVQ